MTLSYVFRIILILLINAAAATDPASAALARPVQMAAGTHPLCPVDDSFKDFLNLAKTSGGLTQDRQIRALHDYLRSHSDLYTRQVIPAPSDARALAALTAARAAHPEWGVLDAAMRQSLEQLAQRFSRAFPDFRCGFPIYVTETFGAMDGAGRLVGGHPALVLGIDSIAHFETANQLPVFLAHELFHRYNFRWPASATTSPSGI